MIGLAISQKRRPVLGRLASAARTLVEGLRSQAPLDGPTRLIPSARRAARLEPPEPTAADEPALSPQAGPLDGLPGDVQPPRVHAVMPGESLRSIAQRELGDESRWPELYVYNRDRIGSDPKRLRPGVPLNLPPPFFKVDSDTRAGLLPSTLDGVTRSAVVATRSGPIDVAEAGVELAGRLGGGVNAMVLTALMRGAGVTRDSPVYRKGMEQIRAITGRDLSPVELRDLDHFLTAYADVHEDADPTTAHDAAPHLRVLAAEASAVGTGAATVAYSAVRGLSQMTGVDFVKYATRGTASAFGLSTSRSSVNEVWHGLRGALYGGADVR